MELFIQSILGFVYKNEAAFWNKEGVCYIPEHGFEDNALTDDDGYKLDECISYTYKELLAECEGNEEMAEKVFAILDWQFPGTLYDEMKEDEAR